MKQSQLLIGGLVVLVVLGAGFFVMGGKKMVKSILKPQSTMQTQDSPAAVATTPAVDATQSTSGASGASGSASPASTASKTFTITGSNFSFDPKQISVNKGDSVTIVFKNADGFHDWNLDEFNAHTKKIQGGKQDTVTFTADKTGTFEYYCSVGEHRAQGMVGKLTVQ